jgi:hypothetical protein
MLGQMSGKNKLTFSCFSTGHFLPLDMLNNQTNTNMKKIFTLQDEILTPSIVPVLVQKAIENFELQVNMITAETVYDHDMEEYQGDMKNAILNHINTLTAINENFSRVEFKKISLGELAVILIANDDALEYIWNILFNRDFEEFLSSSWTSAIHPDATPE